MTHFSPADYDLTADQLIDKYNHEGDGEHPTFPRCDWRHEVANEGTLRGYWDWVVSQLEQEQDELDRDNPFTHVKTQGS